MTNEWVFFLIVVPLFLTLTNLAWILIIFIHELGHAIPALIFTKNDVKIYIGHDEEGMEGAKVLFGLSRLKIHIKPRLFYFKHGGYCSYTSNNMSARQDLIILFSGATFTLVIASAFCSMAFLYNLHGAIKLLAIVVSVLSLLSFFQSLYPRKTPFKKKDGKLFYSDGYQIRTLFTTKTINTEYGKAIDFYNNKNFTKAFHIFRKIIDQNYQSYDLYNLSISALTQTRDFKLALIYDRKFVELYNDQLTSDDFCTSGYIKSNLGMIAESLPDYEKSIELNPENAYALNNRAYTYNLTKRYAESIIDLDKAISININIPDTYANRGLAKIKLGRTNDGLMDIEYAIILDERNSYAYLNLGIYHFDQGNFSEALNLFEKAKDLDKTTYKIDEHIVEANKMLLK